MPLETDTSMAPNDTALFERLIVQLESLNKNLLPLAGIEVALAKIAAARPVTGIEVKPAPPTTH